MTRSTTLLALLALLTGCQKPSEPSRYAEAIPSFAALRHGSWIANRWIREPANLLAVHETFKKVGYNAILGSLLSESPVVLQDLYVNHKGYNLVDSLVLTYRHRGAGTTYYREFWARREAERNDSAVYVVLRDIQHSYACKLCSSELQMGADTAKGNDTLRALLSIEYRTDSLTEELAKRDFETLRRLGFHQSAYNLLTERYAYQHLHWNRDSLAATLVRSTSATSPWFDDDTK